MSVCATMADDRALKNALSVTPLALTCVADGEELCTTVKVVPSITTVSPEVAPDSSVPPAVWFTI